MMKRFKHGIRKLLFVAFLVTASVSMTGCDAAGVIQGIMQVVQTVMPVIQGLFNNNNNNGNAAAANNNKASDTAQLDQAAADTTAAAADTAATGDTNTDGAAAQAPADATGQVFNADDADAGFDPTAPVAGDGTQETQDQDAAGTTDTANDTAAAGDEPLVINDEATAGTVADADTSAAPVINDQATAGTLSAADVTAAENAVEQAQQEYDRKLRIYGRNLVGWPKGEAATARKAVVSAKKKLELVGKIRWYENAIQKLQEKSKTQMDADSSDWVKREIDHHTDLIKTMKDQLNKL